ncbi:MerC domain-containing protein [Carboxylicivirga sp. RSCT41]|uniref:MerC domain-containing protein n=1 Tax=Carboxylicivirga agarovorans TaxID=3417570 RepID=UPI003D3424A0
MSRKILVSTSIIGFITSALSFLGIISCCGFPVIAAFLAWFGIGVSQLAFFSQYQSWFTGIAVIALMYGFYTTYRKPQPSKNKASCCTPDTSEEQSCCSIDKGSNRIAKVMLWLGLIAVSATFLMNDKNTTKQGKNCCASSTETTGMQQSDTCCPN